MLRILLALPLLLLNIGPCLTSDIHCYGPTHEDFNPNDCSYILAHLLPAAVRVRSTTSFHRSLPFIPNSYVRHNTCRVFIGLDLTQTHIPLEQNAWHNADFRQMWATLRNGAERLSIRCVESGYMGIFYDPSALDDPPVYGQVGMFPASVEPRSLDAQILGMRERISDGDMKVRTEPLPDKGDLMEYTVYDV